MRFFPSHRVKRRLRLLRAGFRSCSSFQRRTFVPNSPYRCRVTSCSRFGARSMRRDATWVGICQREISVSLGRPTFSMIACAVMAHVPTTITHGTSSPSCTRTSDVFRFTAIRWRCAFDARTVRQSERTGPTRDLWKGTLKSVCSGSLAQIPDNNESQTSSDGRGSSHEANAVRG